MNSKNVIQKGINQSADKLNLPNDSIYMNSNGRIIYLNQGSLRWSNDIKNYAITITRNSSPFFEKILKIGKINERIIIFSQISSGRDSIGEITFTDTTYETAIYTDIIRDIDLNFSLDHPIIDFFSIYESNEKQTIYFNDAYNSPRALNIENVPNPFYPEMLNFTPPYDKGTMEYTEEVSGNLLCGVYFYTFRLISQDGAATGYQNFTNGLNVAPGLMSSGSGIKAYQDYQGDQSSKKSNTGHKFIIENLDVRYATIEIVAFRSTDYNISENGIIVAKLNITGTTMYFSHTGSENLGSVSINDVIIPTRYINRVTSMDAMKNRNSMANFDEREEIPESGNIDNYKITGVEVTADKCEIPSDYAGMVPDWQQGTDSDGIKGMHGIPRNHVYLLKNQWYWNGSSFILGDGITLKTPVYIPYLRIKKYTEAGGTIVYKNIELNNEFTDFKGKKVSEVLKTYRGQETYRFGILPIDKETGKYLGVRWIGDKEIAIRSGWWAMAVRYLTTSGYSVDQTNLNLVKIIINNLDISDLVTTNGSGDPIDCKISGFHIVRAPLDEQVISEGALLTMLDIETGGDRRGLYPFVGAWIAEYYQYRQKNLYQYYSPEHLFGHGDQSVDSADVLKLITYLEAWLTDNNGIGQQSVSTNDHYNKYIDDIDKPAVYLPDKGDERTINTHYDLELDISTPDIAISEVNLVIKNLTRRDGLDGLGGKSRLFVINETEVTDQDMFASQGYPVLSYIAHMRPKSNLYGGTSDAALAATKYISTGHYQEVTLDILSDIKQIGGEFIFNGIDVFGGDSYMDIMDIQRIMNYAGSGDETSHAIFFPVCTKVNLTLRTGRHAAKDRCYRSTNNPSGIGFGSGLYNNEEFNYNDAYSTDDIGQYFSPLPFGFSPKTESPMQIIYSNVKILGETIDTYRIFPVNNIKNVDSSYGPIISIRNMRDYMLYWQTNGMGYLPMSERIMTNNINNQPVQLGIGGVYDRYDMKTQFYGCQHPASIVKTENGYVWFDFQRKAFVYLTSNMQLTDESIIKGLEPYLENNLDPELIDHNMPLDVDKYGIFSYYDENYKEIVMSFKQPNDNNFSIGFSERMKQFIAIYDWTPNVNMFFGQNMFTSIPEKTSLYIHDRGIDHLNYGSRHDKKIIFIVNNPNDIPKIFDNLKVIGNNNFFSYIKFRNESIGEVTENYVDLNNVNINKYLKYRNGEWITALPFDNSNSRMRGHYLEIELGINSDRSEKVELLNLITKFRKVF